MRYISILLLSLTLSVSAQTAPEDSICFSPTEVRRILVKIDSLQLRSDHHAYRATMLDSIATLQRSQMRADSLLLRRQTDYIQHLEVERDSLLINSGDSHSDALITTAGTVGGIILTLIVDLLLK